MIKKSIEFKADSISGEGVIKGYLNVFNIRDHAGDITQPGAFAKSILAIERKGKPLSMLYQHDTREPIGIWKSLREDAHGLFAVGQINLEIQRGREVFSNIQLGAIDGISIGYTVDDEEYDRDKNANLLKEASLKEASIVTFPCNEESVVIDAKAECETIRKLMNDIYELIKAA